VKWEHKLDTELDGSMLFKYFVIYLQVWIVPYTICFCDFIWVIIKV
jgi:hypothetical protein